MTSWKLIVEDYGKIKSAKIEVAPLTLFVGDNNSGKSYLLSLLWGIKNFGVKALIGTQMVKNEQTEFLVKWICEQIEIAKVNKKHEISLAPLSDVLELLLNTELEKNKDKLVRRIFNSENLNIGKLSIELGNLREESLNIELNEALDGFEFFVSNKHKLLITRQNLEEDLMNKDELAQWVLVVYIYNGIMNIGELDEDSNTSIYLPAARTGFMLTKDIINKVGRRNTFNLVEEKEAIIPFIRPINQFLDTMGDLSVESLGKTENLELVHDIENDMTNGTIEFSTLPNKEIMYVPVGYDNGIPLRLTSAVVSELSPLILILKHKKFVDHFFYEEPEMCLHPQLQHKMGKVISRIVNAGIGMVLTTHSDIMLQHFNNMIKLAKRPDCKEICEQLGYTELDLLNESQIKVYQLRAEVGEKTTVEELVCGENGFAIPTFNDALDIIMNDAYEIQG